MKQHTAMKKRMVKTKKNEFYFIFKILCRSLLWSYECLLLWSFVAVSSFSSSHCSTETAITAVHDELVRNVASDKVSWMVLDGFVSYAADHTHSLHSNPSPIKFTVSATRFGSPSRGVHCLYWWPGWPYQLSPRELPPLRWRQAAHRWSPYHQDQRHDRQQQQCIGKLHRRDTKRSRWCASWRLHLNPVRSKWSGSGRPPTWGRSRTWTWRCTLTVTPLNWWMWFVILVWYWTKNYPWSCTSIRWPVTYCFFQILRLKQVHRILDPEITTSLITVFVTSHVDYCDSLLAQSTKVDNCPASTDPECSRSSYNRNRPTRSRDQSMWAERKTERSGPKIGWVGAEQEWDFLKAVERERSLERRKVVAHIRSPKKWLDHYHYSQEPMSRLHYISCLAP